MLLIYKPGTSALRTVVDLQAQNANTHKLSLPLPNMDGILCCVAAKPYCLVIGGQDTYEKICIVPEHVDQSTIMMPDGNMVSLVIQIGDCNTPVMYQVLINYLFSSFLGCFMDIYLDDIVIYSDMLEEHLTHVKQILDILH